MRIERLVEYVNQMGRAFRTVRRVKVRAQAESRRAANGSATNPAQAAIPRGESVSALKCLWRPGLRVERRVCGFAHPPRRPSATRPYQRTGAPYRRPVTPGLRNAVNVLFTLFFLQTIRPRPEITVRTVCKAAQAIDLARLL